MCVGKVRCNASGKKLTKSQGSSKLGRACTSQIICVHSKNILVTWKKTHYGHCVQLQHLRILQEDRSVIACKLINGVPSARCIKIV